MECGTTAIGEIVSDHALIPLYASTDISGRLFLEAIGQEPGRNCSLLAAIDETISSFILGRLKPGISPHAPHTVSQRFVQELMASARNHSIPSIIHLSESREEAAFMHDSSGKIASVLYPFADWEAFLPSPQYTTSTAYLESLGVLSPQTSVVHCVHITPDDAHLLKKRGVTAILCPRSNDRLVVGKAPAALLKKSGIPLALGTDSLASNDSLSLWDEMRFLRNEFPGVFTPEEILEMATLGAAKALHLESESGSLEKGKRGDFLVLQLPRQTSPDVLAETLIEESRLMEVFIGGKAI
jgi:cytosine/adenosine deaminase-related metal-dependent hydrolase